MHPELIILFFRLGKETNWDINGSPWTKARINSIRCRYLENTCDQDNSGMDTNLQRLGQTGGQRVHLCTHKSDMSVERSLKNNPLPVLLIKKPYGSAPFLQCTPELKMVQFVYSNFLPGHLLTEQSQPNPMAQADLLTLPPAPFQHWLQLLTLLVHSPQQSLPTQRNFN